MTVLEQIKERIHKRINYLENEKFSNNLPSIEAYEWVMDILPEYFPLEKQQIMDAHLKWQEYSSFNEEQNHIVAEQYYTSLTNHTNTN